MAVKVAVHEALAQSVQERADELGVKLRVVRVGKDGAALDDPNGTEVVVRAGGLQGERLRRFLREVPTVRWVHTTSAGVDAVMIPEVVESEIVVTRTRGMHDRPVAEFAMLLMLAAAKHFPEMVRAQVDREWLDQTTNHLAFKTLVIVGYGAIGRALARRAKAFEMRVIGVRRRPEPDELADEVVGVERLREALGRADYVVLVAPSTPESRQMIGAGEIEAMPPHAVLVNVGRGELVDEEALGRLLREGRIAGAMLDTFSSEPLPTEHPFWTNPRVVVTPHAAGVRQASINPPTLDQFLENVRRFARGEAVLNQVDKRLGY